MSDDRKSDKPGIYYIKVRDILDRKWSDWFDGFDIRSEVEGETLLIHTAEGNQCVMACPVV
jgi:hypothetical protein